MQHKADKTIFMIYILGFVVLALAVALNQPMVDTPPLYANPPDEHARFLVPQYICEYGEIPTGLEEEIRIPSYGFSYGLYNVFPYIVQGYVMRVVNIFTDSQVSLLFAARMVNVFCGQTLWLAVLLCSNLFASKYISSYLCEYGFLLYAVHRYDGLQSCLLLSGWYQLEKQLVDEWGNYSLCPLLL